MPTMQSNDGNDFQVIFHVTKVRWFPDFYILGDACMNMWQWLKIMVPMTHRNDHV